MFDSLSLPILRPSFKFYYAPYPVTIEVRLAKISFSKLLPIKSYRGLTSVLVTFLLIQNAKVSLVFVKGQFNKRLSL